MHSVRGIAALAIGLLTAAGAAASDTTPQEFNRALTGCWIRDATPIEVGFLKDGYFNSHEVCFEPGYRVSMWSLGGNADSIEGREATGEYSISEDKLFLRGEVADGWLFDRGNVVCDATVGGDTLRLHNCIGSGDGFTRISSAERLDDTSYERKQPGTRPLHYIEMTDVGLHQALLGKWYTAASDGGTQSQITFDADGTQSNIEILMGASEAVGTEGTYRVADGRVTLLGTTGLWDRPPEGKVSCRIFFSDSNHLQLVDCSPGSDLAFRRWPDVAEEN